MSTFQELLSCHQHRPVVQATSCFIQAITLDCPTAMVWNNAGEGKASSWLTGSPLDLLPCPPSDLPMPPRYNNQHIRAQLRVMEEHIRQRSRSAENRWSLDKYALNVAGSTINRVLGALDSLDRHCFDRVDSNNSLDTLYNKIFGSSKETTNENPSSNSSCSSTAYPGNNSSSSSSSNNAANNSDEAIVRTLCEWAVSVQRCGEHRALVVARLLEKRQNNLSQAENDMPDEKDSVTSNQMVTPGGCTFQGLLLKFLDTQAPVYDENALSVRSQEFGNLVLLFSELIRQDVFSHDTYMCTLISRGDLATGTPDLKADSSFGEKKEDGTDNIDDDLGKILQKIAVNTSLEESGSGGRGELGVEGKQRPPRHLVYAQHFPLPQDDAYMHEINQRYVLLYGVGKARDEARAAVKKLTKEISKLFSKKCSNDIAEGKRFVMCFVSM
ncbi:mediator of RNA polymerase II transcription subunit 12-like protein isoform X3 [Scylla paramamosain]|uniref:mediator of RNA polymerase II transcription subunit 12-like protein isoform X3 n=1 Tax=Scylla paramamosain TaxID=85552 RepID=UPI003082E74E